MSTLHAQEAFANLILAARKPLSYTKDASQKSLFQSVADYFSAVINALEQFHEDRRRARRDAYLSEATSVYDLEWRMRELDRQGIF
jgi:hypothetical protein